MNATISNLEGEEFRDLDLFPGYQVSNFGRVKSLKHKEDFIMKPRLDNCGYMRIALSIAGKHKFILVHQLVAIGFLGHTPCGLTKVVNHKNKDKQYNYADNFEITTMRGNAHHALETVKGYFWHNYSQRWRAKISINGKMKWLGSYKTEEEARAAYLKALKGLN